VLFTAGELVIRQIGEPESRGRDNLSQWLFVIGHWSLAGIHPAIPIFPLFQHSIIPFIQYTNSPFLQYSTPPIHCLHLPSEIENL